METKSFGARMLPIEPPRLSVRENLRAKAGSEILCRALRLGLTILAARWLGPAAYGAYAYAFGLANVVVQGADLGLHLHLTREIAVRREPPQRTLAAVLRGKLLLAGCVAIVLLGLGAGPTHGPAGALLLWLVGAALLADSFLVASVHVFRGFQDLRFEARANMLQAAAMFGIGLLALGAGGGAASFAGALLVANALALGVAAAWVQRRFVRPDAWWHSATLRDALGRLRETLPLGVAIVLSVLYFRSDVVWLGARRGAESAAVYASAARLIEGAMIVPAAALAAVFPAFSAAATPPGQELRRLFHRTAGALAGIAVLAAVLLGIGAPIVVMALYGPAYAGAADVLRVLALALPFIFVNYAQTHLLVALGLLRSMVLLAAVCFVVNLGALAMLVPRYGTLGAAVAKLATEVLLCVAAYPIIQGRTRSGSR